MKCPDLQRNVIFTSPPFHRADDGDGCGPSLKNVLKGIA